MAHAAAARWRIHLFASATLLAAPLVVHAQNAPAKAPAASSDVSEVVVTGSRIRRSPADENQPLQVLGNDAVVERGLLNVAEAINDLPQVGVPESPRGDQGANVGRNYINLFGLGSQRTLTLVDGQRFVSSNPGSSTTRSPGSQVDLNNIPVLLIDRVEVIQATGAATYGSDAIAGVANIILKKNFDGVLADVQAGESSRGDYFNYAVRGLVGHSFADGRGNVEVSYERTSNDPLFTADRSITRSLTIFGPNPANTSRTDGIPAQVAVPNWHTPELSDNGVPFLVNSPAISSILTIPDPNHPGARVPVQFGPDGSLIPYNIGQRFGTAVASGGDGTNLARAVSLLAPVERDLVYAVGRYELTDNLRVSTQLMGSWVKATELSNQGSRLNSPLLGGASSGIALSVNNAFLTPQARSILQSQGVTSFFLGRSNADIYEGQVGSNAQTQRAVVTVDGDFKLWARDFYWNASANYGHSGGEDRAQGIVQQRFLNAVDAVLSPSGQVVCRVTLQNPTSADPAVAGCKPLNLFGFGAPSREAINYVLTDLVQQYDLYETDFQANLGGDLIKLPGGMVKFSAGLEHRGERSKFSPNDASRLGLARETAVAPVSASYHTNEAYGEVSIPIFGEDFHLPFVKALSLDAAGRIVDNSQAGRDHAWNVGGRWTIADGLTVRGSVSRTFRGPSIVELFQPRSSFNQSLGTDPCDARFINSGPNPSARQRNCQALFQSLGLPATFQLSSVGASVAVPQTLGGNPNLKNETADSWTAGVVFEPKFVPGLSLAVDYVSISIRDGIATFNGASILSTCFDSPSPSADVCGLVARDRNAQITGVTTGYVNAGYTNFRGFSYAAAYRFEIGERQRVNLTLDVLNTQRLETSVSGLGFDLSRSAGTIASPYWRGQFRATYSFEKLQLSWSTNYVGPANFNNLFTVEDQFPLRVGQYLRHDLSAQYELTPQMIIRGGVNNITDEFPNPLALNQNLAGGTGYDIIGRAFYAGVRLRF